MYIHMYRHIQRQKYTHGYGGIWCYGCMAFSFHRSYQISHQITCKVYTLHSLLHFLSYSGKSTKPAGCIGVSVWVLSLTLSNEPYFPFSPIKLPSIFLLWIALFHLFSPFPIHISFCFHLLLCTSAPFSRIFIEPTLKVCSLFPASLSSSLHYSLPSVLLTGLLEDGSPSLVML